MDNRKRKLQLHWKNGVALHGCVIFSFTQTYPSGVKPLLEKWVKYIHGMWTEQELAKHAPRVAKVRDLYLAVMNAEGSEQLAFQTVQRKFPRYKTPEMMMKDILKHFGNLSSPPINN